MRSITLAVVLALPLIAGCESVYPFPGTVDFGGEELVQGTRWQREGTTAAVYVWPGQSLPRADVQVGVMISYEHTTAKALHGWIEYQFTDSPFNERFFTDFAEGAVCVVGRTEIPDYKRTYLTVTECHTGVERAGCIQVDEELDEATFMQCQGSSACYRRACDERWETYGENMANLLADLMSKR